MSKPLYDPQAERKTLFNADYAYTADAYALDELTRPHFLALQQIAEDYVRRGFSPREIETIFMTSLFALASEVVLTYMSDRRKVLEGARAGE